MLCLEPTTYFLYYFSLNSCPQLHLKTLTARHNLDQVDLHLQEGVILQLLDGGTLALKVVRKLVTHSFQHVRSQGYEDVPWVKTYTPTMSVISLILPKSQWTISILQMHNELFKVRQDGIIHGKLSEKTPWIGKGTWEKVLQSWTLCIVRLIKW